MNYFKAILLSIVLTTNLIAQEPPSAETATPKTSKLVKGMGKIVAGTAMVGTTILYHVTGYQDKKSFDYLQELAPNNASDTPRALAFNTVVWTPASAGLYMIKKGIQDCIATYRNNPESPSRPSFAAGVAKIAAGLPLTVMYSITSLLILDTLVRGNIRVRDIFCGGPIPLATAGYLVKSGIQECYQAYKEKKNHEKQADTNQKATDH